MHMWCHGYYSQAQLSTNEEYYAVYVIWRHARKDIVFSCNLRCQLIFLHGRSRTYRVASLRAGPVGRISYNMYFDCKHVRYVTRDLINEYTVIQRAQCW